MVIGPGGEGAKAAAAINTDHYHQPSDDMDLPFVWSAGTKFMALNLAIARWRMLARLLSRSNV